MNKIRENSMSVCDDCHNFKTFGKKCYYYWEKKKICSQFKNAPEAEPQVVGEDLIQIR